MKMYLRLSWFWVCLLGLIPALSGQDGMTTRHDWHFQGTPLAAVLDELAQGYSVRFAYSRDYIPLSDPVHVQLNSASLDDALHALFAGSDVLYRSLGDQVLLRKRSRQIETLSQKETPTEVPQQTPLYQDPRMQDMLAEKRRLWARQMPLLQRRQENSQINIRSSRRLVNSRDYYLPALERFGDPLLDSTGLSALDVPRTVLAAATAKPSPTPAAIQPAGGNDQPTNRLAQISLLPYLGTNMLKSNKLSNNVSVNLLWGTSGGVEGLEVGGIANTVVGNMQGIQAAGLVNVVTQDVVGTQFAGLGNVVAGHSRGVQLGGLFNRSGSADAIQIGGVFNSSAGDFSGVQIASLFNRSGGDARSLQMSLFLNAAKGDTKSQISGFMNVGGDVSFAQVSPVLNVAKSVKGIQIGLINVADTVSGVPIGLLNIVRKGYNRVELSTSEFFYGNLAIKVGVKPFYNIFIIGGRFDEEPNDQGEQERVLSWGVGYGIGSAITLGPRYLLNLEAVTLHVNEREDWTDDLHQLYQFKILVDGRIGRSVSVFAGPVGNLMMSRLTDPEDGTIGTRFAPYTLYDKTQNGTNIKAWIGLNAGIRF
jgi:hypothetical protein